MNAIMMMAAAAFYAVEPMSSEKYLPDAPPAGGVKGGEVRMIAAKGEYESGSFVVTSDRDLKDVTAEWSDLVTEDGAKIPASAIDLKIVVCWYQQGSAWYSYFSDMTRRILTPELLVHDENLIFVDHETKDNYVRCDYRNGVTDWYWTTYLPGDCGFNGSYYTFRNEWVHDAPTLQPFTLEKGRFKQFWLTLGVPKTAKAGLYRGNVKLKIENGKCEMAEVPLLVRVLPFELPHPAVFRDMKRPFEVSMLTGEARISDEAVAKDFIAHNLRNPHLKTDSEAELDALGKFGFDTSTLRTILPCCGISMSYPPAPDDRDWKEYQRFRRALSNSVERIRRRFGDKTVPGAYGADEAGPTTVMAERAAWKCVHEAGGRTEVSSQPHDYILFALDTLLLPEQPSPKRKELVDRFHASNPDMKIGWYADPHSGPENPELARRQYGWQTWRNNYDTVAQYCMFVRGWSEFNRPYENGLRSLSFAYAGDRQIIDTLQWEGFREAIDDIRYGTLLKTLALEAAASKDVDLMYEGRAALAYLAQVPYETSSLDALRYEMIEKILRLKEKMKK